MDRKFIGFLIIAAIIIAFQDRIKAIKINIVWTPGLIMGATLLLIFISLFTVMFWRISGGMNIEK